MIRMSPFRKSRMQPVYYILVVALIALFGVLQPSISARIFPQKRELVLKNFLQQVQQKQELSPQDFWQFREAYSPGSFSFDEQTASVAGVLNLYHLDSPKTVLLEYHSPLVTSKDEVMDEVSAFELWLSINQNIQRTIFADPTTHVFYDQQNVLRIVFIKSIDEMKTANGFFDYTKQEQNLLRGKVWVNETWIAEKL